MEVMEESTVLYVSACVGHRRECKSGVCSVMYG